MSAYSGGTPLACSTVTRKVKTLPISRWLSKSSPWPSLVSAISLSLRSEKRSEGIFYWSDLCLKCSGAASGIVFINPHIKSNTPLYNQTLPACYQAWNLQINTCSSLCTYSLTKQENLITITITLNILICIGQNHLPPMFPREDRRLKFMRAEVKIWQPYPCHWFCWAPLRVWWPLNSGPDPLQCAALLGTGQSGS